MDTSDRILLALGDIKEDIGALGADVRSLDRQIAELKQTLRDHVHDDEMVAARVSKLEHAQTRTKAMVATVSGIVSVAVTLGAAALKGYPWAH